MPFSCIVYLYRQLICSVGTAIRPFVKHLLPVFSNSIRDSDDEVRSNSVFGLGLLATYGGEEIVRYDRKNYAISSVPCTVFVRHYQSILQTLLTVLRIPSQAPRVVDNVCAAFCRMIGSHPEAVPQEEAGSGLQGSSACRLTVLLFVRFYPSLYSVCH